MTLSLNALANRIGKGYSVDFRAPEPDEAADEGQETLAQAQTLNEVREIPTTIQVLPVVGEADSCAP